MTTKRDRLKEPTFLGVDPQNNQFLNRKIRASHFRTSEIETKKKRDNSRK